MRRRTRFVLGAYRPSPPWRRCWLPRPLIRAETGLGSARCLEKSARDWSKTSGNSTCSIHRSSNEPSAISIAGSTSSTRRGRPSISRHFAATTTGSISLPETKQRRVEGETTRRTDGPDQEARQGPPGSAGRDRALPSDLSTWETIRRSSWRRSIRSGKPCRRPSDSKSRKCNPGLGGKSLFEKGRGEEDRCGTQAGRNSTRRNGSRSSRRSPRITGRLLLQELEERSEARAREILRRQAINYHFLARSIDPSPSIPTGLPSFWLPFRPGCNRVLTIIRRTRRDGG